MPWHKHVINVCVQLSDEVTGKTALLKALMHLKDGRNDTIGFFLDIAEKTGDLESLVNASYKDIFYNGKEMTDVCNDIFFITKIQYLAPDLLLGRSCHMVHK